jgi:hypothetical protein
MDSKPPPGYDSEPPTYDEALADSMNDVLQPVTLSLDGKDVVDDQTKTLLYQLSADVTTGGHHGASIKFKRADQDQHPKEPGAPGRPSRNAHLFYLAHPMSLVLQEKPTGPTYYLTAVAASNLGNVALDIHRSRVQRPEFTALVSPGRSARDDPLFSASEEQRPLFVAKSAGMLRGGRYKWTDAQGDEVAVEEEDGGKIIRKRRLVVTKSLKRYERDALAALWVLRQWFEAADPHDADVRKDGEHHRYPPGPLHPWNQKTNS